MEERSVTLEDGQPISCYLLDYSIDESVFCEWAKHIRRHYEPDAELAKSLSETGIGVEEYLRTYVVPQKGDPFGSTARSNDFTEIMISDLLEFVLGYTVPRCKQRNRSGKTQSEHGTDILAYKYVSPSHIPDDRDELLAVEVKAGLSSDKALPIFDAIADSHKYDEVRHALTLNYYRKKLHEINNELQAGEIARFQQKSEHDYIITYIAAAVISRTQIENNIVLGIRGGDLEMRQNDKIFLVHGKTLVTLAHDIYERCIK